MQIADLVRASHNMAVLKGFREDEVNVGEKLMLVVTEIAEALEEVRGGRGVDEVYTILGGIPIPRTLDSFGKNEKPEGFLIELADAVIRIADLCGKFDLDLEGAIQTKLTYNSCRPHKHGKQF